MQFKTGCTARFIFEKIGDSALIFDFFNMHHKAARRAGARGEHNER
jgi:hypothetical protein